MACGSKESEPPFPFPPRGKPGREGIPPRREHAVRQQKALAHIDAAGSPHKRAAAPLCIPCFSTTEFGYHSTWGGRADSSKLDRTTDAEKRLHKILDTTI